MLSSLFKMTIPLVLVFALISLSGAAAALENTEEKTKADLCCSTTPDEEEQSATACADPGCSCLSCSIFLPFFTHFAPSNDKEFSQETTWEKFIPSAPEQSIEYPPEIS